MEKNEGIKVYSLEFPNSLFTQGLPKHLISLKIGVCIRLMKNIKCVM